MTRKTNRIFSIATLAIALAVLVFSCKKDEDPNIQSITFEREYFQYTPTTVTVSGVYSYDGRIDGIKMQVGQRNDLADAHAFVADIDGTNYTVEVTGLQPGTEYHYCYEVDYGFSKPYKTETKTFATPADSPLVKTLDVMSIDSTTVRVNCETVSDGGMEITERGVCWNTYGNPNLDDESLTYTSAGLGQYSCRINGLALGKKYYVKAYAKNASGIGFGEELEFETAAPPGMPVSIELSCDPEEGGNVSGGGTYMVGSQCTVRAVANSGYTFVNWTENGNQVSTDATYTFNVTRECHLVANFTTQAYIITAEVTPDNSGTVTGAGGYNYGEECTLTAIAKPGYEFVKWTKNGNNVSTNASFTFSVNASATYVAHFQTKSYTVTVSAQPSNGGSTIGGGTYNYGQSCTVRATSAEGYTFVNWTDNGDEVSSNANYTFTVMGNRSLVANFTLQAVLPTVTTSDVTDITQTSAIGGGHITDDGGASITARGICWSTSHNPTTSGSHANSGTGTGSFTVNMTGLTANTTYYVRAYAINSAGTSYGSEVSFTSLSGGGGTVPTGAINGLFTINANGDQVYFSQGNLQYQASTDTWRFAENQWDYVGEGNSNISSNYSGWIDLFGWGTSGWNCGNTYYHPWDSDYSNYGYGPSGQNNLTGIYANADWGVYNAISNGGNQPGLWRTLTNDEWYYIFNYRGSSALNGVSHAHYAKGNVNGVSGIVLFPDIYIHPSTAAMPASESINNPGASYTLNNWSGLAWSAMVDAGCVFLPAAGNRNGTSLWGVGGYGNYWSTSYYNTGYSYRAYFSDSELNPQNYHSRCLGFSVRLIQDYNR